MDNANFDLNDQARADGNVNGARSRLDGGKRHKVKGAALSLAEWLARKLPEPDRILGHWLTTTSRVLLVAPTGIGKSMFCIALAFAVASCLGFLRWRGVRQGRVLLVDGEMSRRLLFTRLGGEAHRSGAYPSMFYALNHEDVGEGWAPLNTKEGQAIIEHELKRTQGADLVIFDNVMSLISGNQREEEGWTATMPWIRTLTRRHIAQIWVHHTNDDGKTYGTKIREWGMDTVITLEPVDRPDTDVSFKLTFTKARERMPDTREDFATINVALVNDKWIVETPGDADTSSTGRRRRRSSGFENKYKTDRESRAAEAFTSLCNALSEVENNKNIHGERIVHKDAWRDRAYREGFCSGLTDSGRKKAWTKALPDLKAAGRIRMDNDMVSAIPRTS
jgi:hypothetical protein